MHVNKLIQKIKLNKGKALIITGLLIVIVLFTSYMVAKASPGNWDRYSYATSGINSIIYNDQESEMNKFDAIESDYTLVPRPGELAHGTSNEYTNLTVDTTKRLVSKWFYSGYGPFLNYSAKDINNSEAYSISFNDQNNAYNTTDYAYITSASEDLADAKSVAVYHYNADNLHPLLINSNYNSISNDIINALNKHSIKNMVVVGGNQRFTTLFGIGGKYNIVRIGGVDRNQTYSLLEAAESNASNIYNIVNKPIVNENGIVCDIKDTGSLSDMEITLVQSCLDNYQFEEAASILLNAVQIGTLSNISSNNYAALIGCKENSTSDKEKFLRIYYVKTTGGQQYGVYQYMGQDYFDSVPETPPPPPLSPITAEINPPPVAVAGDDVSISASGSTEETSTRKLFGLLVFDDMTGINPIDDMLPAEIEFDSGDPFPRTIDFNKKVWFDTDGYYGVHSSIVSNVGIGISQTKMIQVLPPVPVCNLVKSGTEKENRKLTADISSSTGGSQRYPINWSKTKWQIHAVPGGNNGDSDIRIQTHVDGQANGTILVDSSRGINNSLDGMQTIDLLFKKAGQYELTVTLQNDYKGGRTATSQYIFNIQPDLPPVADFTLVPLILRNANNKDANGLALAKETLSDSGTAPEGSYSPDGDTIAKRVWIYAFDANNNGIYTDDTWYVYDNGAWRSAGTYNQVKNINLDTVIDNNLKTVSMSSSHVGKYDFELFTREEYGQETIPQFVSISDKRTGNTFGKP